jgi:hypothetical protein
MLRSVALVAFMFASCGLAQAQPGCSPISLAVGAKATTVAGVARSAPPFACFTLRAPAGQNAHVTLLNAPAAAAFDIQGVVKDQYQYSFRTKAQPYQVDVYMIDPGAQPQRFELSAWLG